jgi:glucose/mannose transport system substrate-binding protein
VMVGLLLLFSAVSAAPARVEIFSWWTGAGEEDGLNALIKLYKQNYPGIEVINATVAGGGGINAKSVLQTRMVGGTPPDSFQVHGGAELIQSYVKTGMMEPISNLVDRWEIRDRFHAQILKMCSYRGEIYAIPLNVHRNNILWYNKALLKKHNLAPPRSFAALIRACEKLRKAGITALALGDRDKWEATQLFETLLAMTLGPAKYNGLWTGKTAFNDPGVRLTLERFKQLLEYVNPGHASFSWQGGVKLVFEGKAAFNIMGDWAEGYFKSLGWQPGHELGWVALCGAGGNFMVSVDAFGLPKGAPHRSAAITWLKTVASVAGQDTFNPLKGSIPTRWDTKRVLYAKDIYLRSSLDDLSKLTLTPSIAHGSAASQAFSGMIDDLLNSYIRDGDTERVLKLLIQAARDYLG